MLPFVMLLLLCLSTADTTVQLPPLRIQDLTSADAFGGCEYSYNPSDREMLGPIDPKLYRFLRSGHHFLYAFPHRVTGAAAEGTFGIQTRPECAPKINRLTPTGLKAFGSVHIDGGPLGSLIFRPEENRMYPVTYIGYWAVTQNKNLYFPKLASSGSRRYNGRNLPTFSRNG